MTRTMKLWLGLATSYFILFMLSVMALLWDVLHADPMHAQFPFSIRLICTIPAFLIAVVCMNFLYRERGALHLPILVDEKPREQYKITREKSEIDYCVFCGVNNGHRHAIGCPNVSNK
jgi:hypothetical protein